MGRHARCMTPSGSETGYPRNGPGALAAPGGIESGIVPDIGEP
jgi:hypothetical protein